MHETSHATSVVHRYIYNVKAVDFCGESFRMQGQVMNATGNLVGQVGGWLQKGKGKRGGIGYSLIILSTLRRSPLPAG